MVETRERETIVVHVRERERESELKNRSMGVFLCNKAGQKRLKGKKGGDRPQFPLRGPHSPCHVVSAPSTESLVGGGDDPICPSLSCASPVSGVCSLDACILFKSRLVSPHPCGPEGRDQLEVSE